MRTKNVENRKIAGNPAWMSLILVLIAALILESSEIFLYYFSQKATREKASLQAEGQLNATRDQIMILIDRTENIVWNSVWMVQQYLDKPDSLERVCRHIVQGNPTVVGSTVALVPGYNPSRKLFAPYVFEDRDSLVLLSLAAEEYDYPSQEWFVKPIELGEKYWSEPYLDTGGGNILMTTLSVPVKDRKGRTAAVLTADVSLDWLSEEVGEFQTYPDAFSMIVSRSGRIMVCPNESFVMSQTIWDLASQMEDPEPYRELNRQMLSYKTGSTVVDFNQAKHFVYYAPMKRTGWAMSIVIPQKTVYSGIRTIGLLAQLMQLIGLAMLILILRSFIKSQLKNKDLKEKKERMDQELHIASVIQLSMVPKVFPPFPERHDLDMAATIVPAKEVGGDLYDFFIRGEKLFFCIGDVSGKGVPASLVMAVTRTSFRNIAGKEDSPGSIVTTMNDNLAAMNENNMFVTFFCGVLDLDNGRLRYCNAGHNPPKTLTDSIQTLPVQPNLPLGILCGMKFIEQETVFHYDDALFLYTDGLTEAENNLHEQFGEERMVMALRIRESADNHLKNIKQKVNEFVGDAPQSDDLTMLFIHYLGGDKPDVRRITLHNDIRQISLLPGFLEDVTRDMDIDPSVTSQLNLALEEAVANVISYAYPEGTDGTVDIDAKREGNKLSLVISDNGTAFDPTAREAVDISAGVDKRPIGGLGIHLIREIMDTVSYERRDGKNVLTITKNI